MLVDLDKWKNGLSIEDSTKLEDYSTIFQKAGAVAGVSVDLTQMSRSVEELAILTDDWTTKFPLQALATALDHLNALGLKFSVYKKSFADSRNNLKKIEAHFVSLKNTTAKPTTLAPFHNNQNGQNQPGFDENRLMETTENSGLNATSTWLIILCSLLIVVIIGLLVFIWYKGVLPCCPEPLKVSFDKDYSSISLPPGRTQDQLKPIYFETEPPKPISANDPSK